MPASGRIEELRKRYEENPRRFFAPLANEYRKSGDLEQAIDLCRMHLADAPANLNGQIVFGQALYDAGTLDEARGAFEAAITVDPENLIALRHLGDIGREQGDIPNARQWYRRVLDADRRNEEVLAIMEELTALEAGGIAAAAASAAANSASGVDTIELDEPPMRAPAPSRPSIMSLIGSAPPSDTREMPAMETEEPSEPAIIETVTEAATIMIPGPPAVEPIDMAPEPVEPEAPDADAIDFGMVDPGQSAAADEPADAPDSSFGFDVDLGAASDIPVATSVGDTGDFGVVEIVDDAPFRETEEVKPPEVETAADSLLGDIDLDEPIDLDSFGSEPDEAAAELEAPSPPKLTLVRDEPEDTIDLLDDDEPIAIAEATNSVSIDEFPEVDAPPAPSPATMPRRTTPVVFNFDLSVDDAPRSPTPMAMASVVDETPDVSIDIDEPLDAPRDEPIEAFVDGLIDEPVAEPVAEPTAESAAPLADEIIDEDADGMTAAAELPTEPDEEDIREMPTPIIQPAVEAFATETMAELYVKQGLRHEAIGVYKQLIEARPGDKGLRDRLAEIQDDGQVASGSSARAFFGALSRRTSKGKATGANKLPEAPPRGSLDRLFGGASVGRLDEQAAASLSAAFGSGPATSEESAVDRVFKAGPARPPAR